VVVAALCIGVFGSHVYFGANRLCPIAPVSTPTGLLVVSLAALIGFDAWMSRIRRPSGAWGVVLLAGQFALIEAVAASDCAGFSKFLYLIGPLWAFALFGRTASIGLGLAYIAGLTLRLAWQDPLWYLNREYVTVLLIFSIGLIFVVMMADALARREASRRRAEDLAAELAQSNADLRASTSRIRELAATEERNRVARDIHDSLGHHLTAVAIQLGKARAFRGHDPAQADRAVEDAEQAAREALHEVRESVRTLRDGDAGFVLLAALARLVASGRQSGLEIDVTLDGDEDGYAPGARLALYRAAQEALTNVQHHAETKQVSLTLVLGSDQAVLTIRDHGRGFVVEALDGAARDGHFGLAGLRERIARLGGELHIHSAINVGTVVRVTVSRMAVEDQTPPKGQAP
jgi:signal transduction histidine kinase